MHDRRVNRLCLYAVAQSLHSVVSPGVWLRRSSRLILDRGSDTREWFETERPRVLDEIEAEVGNVALISPSKPDGSIDCIERTDGSGTNTGSTLTWTAGDTIVAGQGITESTLIDTADRSKCLVSGDTVNDAGIKVSEYCVVTCQRGTCFVVAQRDSSLGGRGPGAVQITGSDLLAWVKRSAEACPGENKVTVGVGSLVQPDSAFCIVAEGGPEICTIG
jgi:hypothetical protein